MKLTCIIPAFLFCCGGLVTAEAQEKQIDPVMYDYFTDNHVWFTSGNAAGLAGDNRLEFSKLSLGAELKNGDYRRPQQSDKSKHYLFNALGGLSIGKVYLQGNFNFKQAFDDGVGYTSLLDPYRGTPYQIADSTGGNWRKQQYDMYVKAASPVWFDLFSVGWQVDLAVGRGAKKIDPRPQTNSNRIDVSPSVAFFLGRHTLGGSFHYRRFREDVDLMLYNTSDLQKLYLLRGMGQYFYETFNTTRRERSYEGDGKGFSLQYAFVDGRFTAFVSGKYMNYEEDADDIDRERNRPKRIGRLKDREIGGEARLSLRTGKMIHKLDLGYSSVEHKGTEIGQRFEQTDYVTISEAPDRSVCWVDRIEGAYRLNILNAEGVYGWTMGVKALYEDYDDSYAVANSYIRYTRIRGELQLSKNFRLAERQWLQTGVKGMYNHVTDKTMAYNRANAAEDEYDETIAGGLIRGDYEYFKQDYYGGGVFVKYHFKLAKTQWFSAGIDINLRHADSKDMLNDYLFCIGYLF